MSPCRSALCLSTALLVIAAPTSAQKTATKFPGRGWHKVKLGKGKRLDFSHGIGWKSDDVFEVRFTRAEFTKARFVQP